MQHLLACTLWVHVKALYRYHSGAFRDLHVYMEFLQNYNLGVSGAPGGLLCLMGGLRTHNHVHGKIMQKSCKLMGMCGYYAMFLLEICHVTALVFENSSIF